MGRKIVLKNIAIMFFIFLLSGCSAFSLCEDKELLRITSPNNKIDAVMIRRNCGATTAYSYRIYLVYRGERVPKGWINEKSGLIFVADHVEGESIQWIESNLLEIKYKRARIFEFKNFWYLGNSDNIDVIEVREISLTPPPSLRVE
jgi:hypothetical protein